MQFEAKPNLAASISVRQAKPDAAVGVLPQNPSVAIGAVLTHIYTVRIWRDKTRRHLLWKTIVKNLVTTEGQNKYLDATLKTGLTGPLWYIGLVDNTGFTAYALTDTAAKITAAANPPTTNGWQEITGYSEGNRQGFTPGTISGGSVSNTLSPAVFTINSTLNIRGAFMDSSNTKLGTTGTLLGEADFGSIQAVVAGNVVDVVTTAFFQAC